MKSQSHLRISAEPIHFLSGGEMLGLCGATVKNPVSEMFCEVGVRGMPDFKPLRDCRKCFDKAELITENKIYVYVLREGPEVEAEIE